MLMIPFLRKRDADRLNMNMIANDIQASIVRRNKSFKEPVARRSDMQDP